MQLENDCSDFDILINIVSLSEGNCGSVHCCMYLAPYNPSLTLPQRVLSNAGIIQQQSPITVQWSFRRHLPIVDNKRCPQLNLSAGCEPFTCATIPPYSRKLGSQKTRITQLHLTITSTPDKVPEFMEKHKGTESVLVESVCRKYRVSPPSGWYKTS